MACNQTAVAVLQELCVKRKWNPPIYEETYAGGTPNDPTFHITVTLCNGIRATGIGRQKKAAKHDAAKKALEQLNLPALTYGEDSPRKLKDPSSPMNPHEDFSGNAVGQLSELCITHHLPAPDFTLIGDEGEPHQKTFTYRCSVSSRQEIGVARKKQTAKHLAAVAMIKTLQTNFKDYLGKSTSDTKPTVKQTKVEVTEEMLKRDTKVIERFLEIKDEDLLIPSFDHGLKVSDYHLAFKEKLANLNDIMAVPEIASEKDPMKKVKLVAEALNHKVSTTLTTGKNGDYIAFILLDTVPSAVQCGIHADRGTAYMLAALAILNFLRVMAS